MPHGNEVLFKRGCNSKKEFCEIGPIPLFVREQQTEAVLDEVNEQ